MNSVISKLDVRDVAFLGIFIALILGLGYALALVPNVELVTALIFLSGVLMGVRKGIFVGIVGEFLFSALNPAGSGLLFLPMLLTQIVAMSLVGATGGIVRNYVIRWQPNFKNIVIIGLIGLLLTLFYDIIVSLAFPVSAGFDIGKIVATVSAGVVFSVMHLVANTFTFIFLVPLTAKRIWNSVPYFRK